MRQYTPTLNGRKVEDIPYLVASDLGKAREHLHFRNGKQCKNHPQDRQKEIFCVYEKGGYSIMSFWMQRTAATEKFFARLFQESKYNQHIHFIEWDDRINCSVEDGIYISQTNFFMTKEEFAKFRETIVPYDEVEVRYYGNI